MKTLALLALLVVSSHAAESLSAALRPGHPRLILTPQREAVIKSLATTDPVAKRWQQILLRDGTRMLSSEPEVYSLENKKLLVESRDILKTVSTTAALYRLTGDTRFAERAKKELLSAAAFPDWNPASFLSTAEMTYAFALGYDWLFDILSPAERETLRTAIVEKGLKPGLAVYKSRRGWPKVTHNWNAVCNNGLIIGALAVADTDRETSDAILAAAKESLPKGYTDYAPDGGWPEGPGYWAYGTSYAVYGLACLESALGTDWGLSKSPGFSETGNFRIDLIAPSGMNFGFADAPSTPTPASCMFWLADHFNRPEFDAAERVLAMNRPSIFHLLFFNRRFSTPAAAEALAKRPISRRFTGTNVAILRSSPEKTATWIGIKGGSNKVNHGHLDLGTFILESGGERFTEELGADLYTLPGYFGDKRWTYYRLRTEGQNTLVVDGKNQPVEAMAPITQFNGTSATIDLTSAYPPAKQVLRTANIGDDGSAVFKDRIELPAPSEVVWSVHTRAATTVSGNTATLTRDGVTMKAEILSPSGAAFTVNEVVIPPPQRAEKNLRKLSVRLAGVTSESLAIRFTPR